MSGTLLVAQLGAPTAVINQTLVAIVEEARAAGFASVLGAQNGVLGILHDHFYDLAAQPPELLARVRRSPGSALGSCRYKMADRPDDINRLCEVLAARDVTHLVFIGGNGTMAALMAIADVAAAGRRDVRVVGAPKTIDNDLLGIDHTPGYGSIAKYIAASVREAGRDTDSLYTFDVCTVIETFGRDTGWIAAAAGLASRDPAEAPHLILAPELPLDWRHFADAVRRCVDRCSRCVVVAGEGMRDTAGNFLAPQAHDPSGQMQFGGVAEVLRNFIQNQLGFKTRYNKPGTSQRNASHLASLTDAVEADAVGRFAVRALVDGHTRRMVTIRRQDGPQYRVSLDLVDLAAVAGANRRTLPREFLDAEGFAVTDAFRRYAAPLIRGRVEVPEADDGLPDAARLAGPLLQPITLSQASGDTPSC